MTISIAWVRRIRNCEELIFASDSRLSGDGRTFDAAPKILALPRGDCAIAFAGVTQDAFPMMLQLSLAIQAYGPSRRRSLDLNELKTHALKIFDSMGALIQSDSHVKGSPPDDVPAAEFLLGGYSWIQKQFELWSIRYHKSGKHFVASEAPWATFASRAGGLRMSALSRQERQTGLGRIAFAGDQAARARRLFCEEMTRKQRSGAALKKIDMEPFEIMVKMLRDPTRSDTIGGAPQLVKVYQYMKAISFPVYWPNKSDGSIFLQGRPCIGYENLDTKVVDPDLPPWPTDESKSQKANIETKSHDDPLQVEPRGTHSKTETDAS
jgi:hypothetical protein